MQSWSVSTSCPCRFRIHRSFPERGSDVTLDYISSFHEQKYVSSIFFRVREQVSLNLCFIHHPPLSPPFSYLIFAF